MRYKRLYKRLLALAAAILVAATAAAACNTESAEPDSDGALRVVTTTTFVADLVRSVGGEAVRVEALMGPGIDPHSYNASAGDVDRLQGADMVVFSGLQLEGKMADVFENIQGGDTLVFAVTDGIDEHLLLQDEDNPGAYDPHIWFDVTLWKRAAEEVAEHLQALDSENREGYSDNLNAYLDELDELDQYVRDRVSELPEESRILVTAHDAFRYLGNAYGIEVRGLQGISTEAEAGTADVSALASYIAGNEIKAIFIESSVPPRSIEALQEAVAAQGHQVEIGGELYSDSTGSPGTDAETYIGTFKANIDTIVDALK